MFNGSSTDFQIQDLPATFIFATLDGTISAWSPKVNQNQSIIAIDNSASKASYTGLAITSKPSGNFLYAADNTNNHVDMFDGNFTLVKSFGDPAILNQRLHEGAVLLEDVDKASGTDVWYGIPDVNQAVDVLNAED